jgi:hypothetical protein
MRAQDVHSLSVSCGLCHHAAVMNVDAFIDTMPVPAFRAGMVCTNCGIIGTDVRPNWLKRAKTETLTGMQWR